MLVDPENDETLLTGFDIYENSDTSQRAPHRFVKKILIVEDETRLSDVLRRYFVIQNYECESVDNIFQALNLGSKLYQDYDLIITDLHMPGGLGTELIEKIKKRNPDQKFLIISGNMGDLDPNYHDITKLEKPFMLSKLKAEAEGILAFK